MTDNTAKWHWYCPHCHKDMFAVEHAIVDWRILHLVDVFMMRAIAKVISSQSMHIGIPWRIQGEK